MPGEDTTYLEETTRPQQYIPPRQRELLAAQHLHGPVKTDQLAGVPTCSPVRQTLLLHENSVRNIVLSFPDRRNRTFCYPYKMAPMHNALPWEDFLGFIQSVVDPGHLHLMMQWKGLSAS